MTALVLADLRSRWRSLAALGGGCFRLAGWALAQLGVVACGVVGALLGTQLSPDLSSVSAAVPLRVAVQFASLVFFIAAVAFTASTHARTRAAALGVAVGVTAGSYVANLVALLWSPLGFVRHLNPFGYYSPTAAATHIAWGDAGILTLAGGILLVLARRWLSAGPRLTDATCIHRNRAPILQNALRTGNLRC